MRCLKRNKRPFYYATFKAKTPIKLDGLYDTGEYSIEYDTPVLVKASISATRGRVHEQLFGIDTDYDRVILTDDVEIPITESSVLCVEIAPTYDTDGGLIYDYVVTRVSRGLDFTAIAIKKVVR